MEQAEEWRIARQCTNYEVSNLGRVRHAAKGTIKGSPIAKNGYRVVNLWKDGVGRVYTVHSLVAEAFVGERPTGLCVNHIDGNKLNNLPSNLEYLTIGENFIHHHRIGIGQKGETNGHSKLTEKEVVSIRERALRGERTSDLAREYSVKPPIISQIKHGTRWKHTLPHSRG